MVPGEPIELSYRLIRAFLNRFWLGKPLGFLCHFFLNSANFKIRKSDKIDENPEFSKSSNFVDIEYFFNRSKLGENWDLALSIAFDSFLLQWNWILVLICLQWLTWSQWVRQSTKLTVRQTRQLQLIVLKGLYATAREKLGSGGISRKFLIFLSVCSFYHCICWFHLFFPALRAFSAAISAEIHPN